VSELHEDAFWGDVLVRWPEDVVARMELSAEDADYLRSVGLPTGVDWNLTIAPPGQGSEPQRAEGMPVLAFDGPVPICVDRALGCVVAVDPALRIVNSTVRRFGAFLMIYQDYRLRVRGLEDADAEGLIVEIEQRMSEADSEAMRVPKAYWRLAIEQMREGFL
jgi:hypothetical protein